MLVTIARAIRKRWTDRGGYREVLTMAFPLILSTATWSVLQFTDRVFLTWYSPEAVAASAPAGILNYCLMSVFIGTAGYVSTFVAQYFGAKQMHRIGPALWQGIWFSVAGAVVVLLIAPLSGPIFRLIGHAPDLQVLETDYFRILCYGGFFPIVASAMSGFFSGRGENWPVLWANALSTVANIGLDYVMIFGKLGFPEMGISGAALATVIASALAPLLYLLLMSRRKQDKAYGTRRWKLDGKLFLRMLRFGLPSGVQFFLDFAGFTIFLLFLGRLGTEALAATNITFNINSLAFMPMIGCGIAVSVLVGQYLGQDNPKLAERSTWSGFHLAFVYMAIMAVAYLVVPDIFIAPFAAQADPASFAPLRQTTVVLLRFVALYCMFDTMNIIFASAIKGAGDTRFVVLMIVTLSVVVLIVPSYVGLVLLHGNLYVGWIIVTVYVILLAIAFLLRFLQGRWKSMRVIEATAPSLPLSHPAAPTTELEP